MKTATAKQIHDEIEAASDSLVSSAKAFFVTLEKANIDYVFSRYFTHTVTERTSELLRLGFIALPEVIDQNKSAEERKAALAEAEKERSRNERILYYRKTYPAYKFLTQEQLEGICEKYNLVYTGVRYYTGDVPDKNLKEIADATIRKEDAKRNVIHVWVKPKYAEPEGSFLFDVDEPLENDDLFHSVEFLTYQEADRRKFRYPTLIETKSSITDCSGLYIAAPKSKFTGLERFAIDASVGFLRSKTWRPEPKDPIVFRFVKGGILIISMWGDEA
jgi:hypothetical protein